MWLFLMQSVVCLWPMIRTLHCTRGWGHLHIGTLAFFSRSATRSLMKCLNSVGDRTPHCEHLGASEPSDYCNHLPPLWLIDCEGMTWCSGTYCLLYHCTEVSQRVQLSILVKYFWRSIKMASVTFIAGKESSTTCARCVVWSYVLMVIPILKKQRIRTRFWVTAPSAWQASCASKDCGANCQSAPAVASQEHNGARTSRL